MSDTTTIPASLDVAKDAPIPGKPSDATPINSQINSTRDMLNKQVQVIQAKINAGQATSSDYTQMGMLTNQLEQLNSMEFTLAVSQIEELKDQVRRRTDPEYNFQAQISAHERAQAMSKFFLQQTSWGQQRVLRDHKRMLGQIDRIRTDY